MFAWHVMRRQMGICRMPLHSRPTGLPSMGYADLSGVPYQRLNREAPANSKLAPCADLWILRCRIPDVPRFCLSTVLRHSSSLSMRCAMTCCVFVVVCR